MGQETAVLPLREMSLVHSRYQRCCIWFRSHLQSSICICRCSIWWRWIFNLLRNRCGATSAHTRRRYGQPGRSCPRYCTFDARWFLGRWVKSKGFSFLCRGLAAVHDRDRGHITSQLVLLGAIFSILALSPMARGAIGRHCPSMVGHQSCQIRKPVQWEDSS